MTILPDDWSNLILSDYLKRSATYGVVKAGTFVSSGVPMLRGGDIKAGNINSELPHITPKKDAEYARTRLEANDVVVALVGYPGESALVPKRLAGANISRAVGLLRLSGKLRPNYLVHFLNSAIGRAEFLRPSAGSAQLVVNLKDLNKLEVPCPATEKEQEAIAEALSDADALIEGLERLIAKKRLIKQGAMQELLTRRRRLPGFSGEWIKKNFGEISRIRNQKIHTYGDSRAQKCVELEQMEAETGHLRFWSNASNRHTIKYLFASHDVLFGRLRPYLRKFYLANIEGVCSTEIWPLIAVGVTPSYLYSVVQSDPFITAACESYGTHMPRADWRKLSTIELEIPSDSSEQDAIGSVLLDMDAEIQALETRLEKARAIKEGMMQNLLTGRIRLV